MLHFVHNFSLNGNLDFIETFVAFYLFYEKYALDILHFIRLFLCRLGNRAAHRDLSFGCLSVSQSVCPVVTLVDGSKTL